MSAHQSPLLKVTTIKLTPLLHEASFIVPNYLCSGYAVKNLPGTQNHQI